MNSLPSGTVTFLMTDVEQSTRLWELFPDRMRAALLRHDTLARTRIEQHNGILVKPRGEGDSLFAVFERPTDALNAALDFQHALLAEAWDADVVLRVRMALHTGDADLRDGDYYGATVNRCARIRSAAHGGQILLSQSTSDMTRGLLPPDARLSDLGAHGLKDLQRPERLCQLLCPGWPTDFPPLRSLEVYRHNLPRQLTSFIGRDDEMAQIKSMLAQTCLLTLLGSGGSGKTRLALQVGADSIETYTDGVWFVELAPLANPKASAFPSATSGASDPTASPPNLSKPEAANSNPGDPGLIARAILKTLGCREEAGRDALDTLRDYLKPLSLLLILDNCEHLVLDAAQAVNALLRACPGLRILTTSRIRLNAPGETAWRVPSLLVPDDDPRLNVDAAMRHASLRLFAERAVAARPAFAVTTANLPAMTQICRRLDGIPLAIELAAARVSALSPQQVAQRLDKRFSLLVGGSSAVLERHQTLRALIDWSYDLLSAPERVLLRRLAVFAGGWTLEAAEAVCAWSAIEPEEVLDLLSRLVDASLVIADEQDETTRYRLLETVRQYAQDQLQAALEDEAARECHLRYFLDVAEQAEPHLTGAEQSLWLQTLEAEHDNLRTALAWASGGETRLRLAGALWRFWYARGHLAEGCAWLEKALSSSEDAPGLLVARALHGQGFLAMSRGDYETAQTALARCLTMRRALNHQPGIAETLNSLGMLAQRRDDPVLAQQCYTQSLEIFRAAADRWGTATALNNLGSLAQLRGDPASAQTFYEQSLNIYRALNDRTRVAALTSNLGDIAHAHKDFVAARALFEEALQTFRGLGNKMYIAATLYNLTEALCGLEEHAAACPLLLESFDLQMEIGYQDLMPFTITHLARIAFDLAKWETGAVLLGVVEQLFDTASEPVPADARHEHTAQVLRMRAVLNEAQCASATKQGRMLPLNSMVDTLQLRAVLK